MTVGSPAPDFSLVDQSGDTRALTNYRQRWVVLYFYPKDDTPGCTTEACKFRDDYAAVQRLGAEILGVSIDNRDSHAAFSKKYNLPFPLLADTDGTVAKQYGALWGVWPLKFARRHTFVIDPQGHIAKVYREVDPQGAQPRGHRRPQGIAGHGRREVEKFGTDRQQRYWLAGLILNSGIFGLPASASASCR